MRRMHAYPIGTQVQRTTGHVFLKTADGSWIGRGRWLAAHKIEKRPLKDNERVYHKNGDPSDDSPGNLVVIAFAGRRYRLERSKVVYIPSAASRAAIYDPRQKDLVRT